MHFRDLSLCRPTRSMDFYQTQTLGFAPHLPSSQPAQPLTAREDGDDDDDSKLRVLIPGAACTAGDGHSAGGVHHQCGGRGTLGSGAPPHVLGDSARRRGARAQGDLLEDGRAGARGARAADRGGAQAGPQTVGAARDDAGTLGREDLGRC